MNDAITKIMQNAMFNNRFLGEIIIYKDNEIPAVVEIGGELENNPGRSIAELADSAQFTVKISDAPDPSSGEKITYKGTVYMIDRILLTDTMSQTHTISCSKNHRGIRK